MYEKAGKFYADWRDRTGARKRRSFKSERAALRFEAEQKELAHPKKKALGRPLPAYSAPKLNAGGRRVTVAPLPWPKDSLRRQVQKSRRNSRKLT